jgi:tRNA A37 N6-isopentenylltransferase MiaA
MVAVTLEYNNNNAVVIGILDAIAKMPDVRISETFVPSKAKTTGMEFSRLSLSEQAKFLNRSINTSAPAMTMEEIVQEVRDYRNGK